MRIDKTLKQFIATVLTIIMIVTVIPFAPVALGIETEEESGNYAYATDADFKVVTAGDGANFQYMNLSDLKNYLLGEASEKNVEIILQTNVALINESDLHITNNNGSGVITLNLNGYNITSNYGQDGSENCATVRVDNRPLVITGAGIIENTYSGGNGAYGTAVVIKGTSFDIGENVELKAYVALYVDSLGESEFCINNGIYNGQVWLGDDATQNIRISGGKLLDKFVGSSTEGKKFVLDGGIYYLYEGNFNNYEIVQGYTVAAIQPGDPDYIEDYPNAWKVVAEEPGGGDTPEVDFDATPFMVVTSGGIEYMTLSALNTYLAGENVEVTIILQTNVTLIDSHLDIKGRGKRILDLSGYSITSNEDPTMGSTVRCDDCPVIITGTGIIENTFAFYDPSVDDGRGAYRYGKSVTVGRSLEIGDNVTLKATDGGIAIQFTPLYGVDYVITKGSYIGDVEYNNNKDLIIEGGKFETKSFIQCNSGKIVLAGGVYVNNPVGSDVGGAVLQEGYTVAAIESGEPDYDKSYRYKVVSTGLPEDPQSGDEGIVGYYANVVPGIITLKYSGVTKPAIASVKYKNGSEWVDYDSSNINNDALTITYTEPKVDANTKVAGDIFKIAYTVDSDQRTMYVNTRVRYAPIVHDTSMLANAIAKAKNVVLDTFASPSVKEDLNFVSEASGVDNNLYCSQANKNSLNSVISANERKINPGNDQDTLDKAAAAVDIARINYLQSCTAQLLSVEGKTIKTTNASNVAFWSISYYPEPEVMGGNYSFFEDACNGEMQTIKNPGKKKDLVTVNKDGTYTFFVVCGIDGVSRGFFVYVSVGEEPSKEVILASVAAFTDKKTQNYATGEVKLIANANDGTIQVTGKNIDDVIASYSGEEEFNQYNQFVMAGYTGLTSVTRENTQDGKRLTGFVGAARDGNYSFRVSFLNGKSLCTTVAITGVPEPVEFTSDSKGNITWTAKRGTAVEQMSYIAGNYTKDNPSSKGFLPIQEGSTQVAGLMDGVHTFKVSIRANGTRYTYYTTASAANCNTPAIVVMSSAIGVYPRNTSGIESIAYAKGDIATWDDMTKATGVTYVPITAGGITLDKAEFAEGNYTFMFKIKDNNNPFVYHVYSNEVVDNESK